MWIFMDDNNGKLISQVFIEHSQRASPVVVEKVIEPIN